MVLAEYLLDTCILIRHLRRHQPTSELLARLGREGGLAVASITRTELMQGVRKQERGGTLALLNALTTIALDASIADEAGDYVSLWAAKGFKLDIADAIIGATAIHHGRILVTCNRRHFPMPEIQIYRWPEVT
jgi:predicted nucleic acid-binding protein